MTGRPSGLLPHFEYFVPFFVVIFYVISPTIAQIPVGPQHSGERPPCLTGARSDLRLKTRPRPGHSHSDTRRVHSYSILLWPQDVERFSSSSGFCSSD